MSKSRSVIFTGGTMQPFSEYNDHLFNPLGIANERVEFFTCGHVIAKENLLAIALSEGPTNIGLEYTFSNRNSSNLLDETGRILTNVCNVVKGGIVCFFSSYDYEEKVFNHLLKNGFIKSIENKNRRVFREPKQSSEIRKVLSDYAYTIQCQKKGALLFSVVGGKMSEGINFNDDLGRCIIMFGLPYANIKSPELQEKMNYLNAIEKNSGQVCSFI